MKNVRSGEGTLLSENSVSAAAGGECGESCGHGNVDYALLLQNKQEETLKECPGLVFGQKSHCNVGNEGGGGGGGFEDSTIHNHNPPNHAQIAAFSPKSRPYTSHNQKKAKMEV